MSLFQSYLLQVPQALAVYTNQIVPRLSTGKNKWVSIGVAVALSLSYYINDRVLKPPRNLRHIPYVSYLDTILSTLLGETAWNRSYRVHLPEVDQKNHSLFLEQARLGWLLHVSNPKDAKRVFLKLDTFPKFSTKAEHKNTLNARFTGGDNMVWINGHAWKSHRKIANPAFHRSMPVKLFGKLTQNMFQTMDRMGNDTVDISSLFERWTLDAIGKAGFDFNFNSILDTDSEWFCRYNNLNEGLRDPRFFFFPIFDTTLRWLFPHRVKLHQEMDTFLAMLDDVIARKREIIQLGLQNDALDENEKDLLSLMIEAEESGEGALSNEELKSNLCIFFLAGHDTTASALSFAMHYLAENQNIQQRAREEAIRILGSEPQDILPTMEQTKEMTYINQIMKETLRINGPAPRVLPRRVAHDTELSGTFIPEGTAVVVNIFNIHHSEKVWKDGHVFNPDRFEDNGEASQVEAMAWTPFGNGARQCIGMNFSLCEQRVMLSMLLRKFTWSTPENSIHKNGVVTSGVNVTSPRNLDITFKKRY